MVRLPMPGPADVLRFAERGYVAMEQALGLVPRVTELVGQLERIAGRGEAALDGLDQSRQRADQLIDRTGGLLGEIERVLTAATTLVDKTDHVVAGAQAVSGRAGELLDKFEPTLGQLAPIADRLAASTSPAEVDAVVLLIDTMPELVDRLRKEILPILASMTNVAPDIRELLDTTKEFTTVLGSLPGLGRIKKRIEEHEEEHDRERAEIEASVDRP
jgi:ABC-type transporter Mla subunit MlaD